MLMASQIAIELGAVDSTKKYLNDINKKHDLWFPDEICFDDNFNSFVLHVSIWLKQDDQLYTV